METRLSMALTVSSMFIPPVSSSLAVDDALQHSECEQAPCGDADGKCVQGEIRGMGPVDDQTDEVGTYKTSKIADRIDDCDSGRRRSTCQHGSRQAPELSEGGHYAHRSDR